MKQLELKVEYFMEIPKTNLCYNRLFWKKLLGKTDEERLEKLQSYPIINNGYNLDFSKSTDDESMKELLSKNNVGKVIAVDSSDKYMIITLEVDDSKLEVDEDFEFSIGWIGSHASTTESNGKVFVDAEGYDMRALDLISYVIYDIESNLISGGITNKELKALDKSEATIKSYYERLMPVGFCLDLDYYKKKFTISREPSKVIEKKFNGKRVVLTQSQVEIPGDSVIIIDKWVLRTKEEKLRLKEIEEQEKKLAEEILEEPMTEKEIEEVGTIIDGLDLDGETIDEK